MQKKSHNVATICKLSECRKFQENKILIIYHIHQSCKFRNQAQQSLAITKCLIAYIWDYIKIKETSDISVRFKYPAGFTVRHLTITLILKYVHAFMYMRI